MLVEREAPPVVNADFAASQVSVGIVGFDDASGRVAARRIHQPIGELVLEIVTLAPPIAFYVWRGSEFLQTTPGAGQRLTTATGANGVL